MLPVAPYPFLRLAIFFALGIATFIHFPNFVSFSESWTIGFFIFYVFVFCYKSLYGRNILLGISAHSLCFFLGVFVCKSNSEITKPNHFGCFLDSTQAYIAVVDDEMVAKPNSISTKLRVKSVLRNGNWQEANGNVLVYFSSDSISQNLNYGDWLLINGKPNETERPKNPGEFDYKRFLTFRNIFYQQYVQRGNFVKLKNKPESVLWRFAFYARKKLSDNLKETIGEGQEFAVASMLILGIRHSIDAELFSAYSGAGAVHVLAVSGLHVGLVFGLIQLLLGRFAANRIGFHLCYAFSFLGIWLFGAITAFSPSVLRAVVMFSVVIIGKWTGRKGNLFNTLGFAAFAILLFSPNTIMSVGFQMSFMAVFGIAYFHPKFVSILNPPNKVLKWVWEISCLSVAAQLTTFPLALLYFKQFPTYFLFSNLWVIPAGSLILYLGILYYALNFIFLAKISLGFLLKYLVFFLNKSMFWVLYLPFSVHRTVFFDDWEILAVFGIILSFALLFHLKDKRFLLISTVFALAFSCSRISKNHSASRQNKLIFYSVKKGSCFAIIDGKKAKVYGENTILQYSSLLEFHVLNPLRSIGIQEFEFVVFPKTNFVIKKGANKILVVQEEKVLNNFQFVLKDVDYILITKSTSKVNEISMQPHVKRVILYLRNEKQPFQFKEKIWNLASNGAFELDL